VDPQDQDIVANESAIVPDQYFSGQNIESKEYFALCWIFCRYYHCRGLHGLCEYSSAPHPHAEAWLVDLSFGLSQGKWATEKVAAI
jgi:hypothetical protein